jgi:uridine phosphorylase
MKGLGRKLAVVAVAALLAGLGSCGGDSDHKDSVTPVPTTGTLSAGVITGFGSVYVDGVRYDTASAQVTMDGEPATPSQLQVGQYVEVKGHAQGAEHHADVIRYHNVLEGPITSIDPLASSFVAMGQTVRVSLDTSLGSDIQPASIDGLRVGDVVEVSGIVPTAGVIDATRVDIKPDGGPFDVTGYVTNLSVDTHRFNINDLVVDYSAANMDDFATGDPSAGDLVLVKGFTFDPDGTFAATRVELRSDDWLMPGPGDLVDVQGVISEFESPTAFRVGGWAVTTTQTTMYENGTVAKLANDVMVKVKGMADASGVLVAAHVSFMQVNTLRIVAQVDNVAADGSIELLGLAVATDDATRYEDRSQLDQRDFGFEDLTAGTWVDVRGYEAPPDSGTVLATQVVRIDPADEVSLRGPFGDPVRPDFHILSALVRTTDATKFRLEGGVVLTPDQFFATAEGQLVEAWGSWNGVALTAERVEVKVEDD